MRTRVKARGDVSSLQRLKKRRALLPGMIKKQEAEIRRLDVEIVQLEGLKKFRESPTGDIDIVQAGFRNRVENRLRAVGIMTIKQLVANTEQELRKGACGLLGDDGIANIRDIIGKMGLRLS